MHDRMARPVLRAHHEFCKRVSLFESWLSAHADASLFLSATKEGQDAQSYTTGS
jgi:hypothetical protein